MASSSDRGTVDQIPDIDDDRSRLRVSKACSRCRVRKDRCDGLKPCTSCRSADKPCTYEVTTKKRGLPEGYVRGLEKLTTLACQTIDGLEEVLVSYLKDEEVQKTWNATDELYTSWKESTVHQQLYEFLLLTTGNGSGVKRKRGEDTSSENSPAESLDTILEQLRSKRHRVCGEAAVTIGPVLPNSPLTPPAREEELPVDSKELLDLYFTNVHCWFPILERPAVLKAFYGSRRAPEKLLDGGKALLWAIFAYAVMLGSSPDKFELSQRWSEQSLKYVPTPYTNAEDVQDFDVMQAQALIVLSLLRLGNGQWLGAWMCTGRAARILLAKSADPSRTRKATLQGCFIVESLLNVHFESEQPLFPVGLIQTMIEEDGHEEWECWATTFESPSFALSTFNRLTKVFLILHEALMDPGAAKEAPFVRSKLTSIHDLAQEHFSTGINHPTIGSPPHHVYFQIGLLFAQLRLVSQLHEMDAIQFDLSSLTMNVLGLFEICEKSSHIGLIRVPPLFADILNLAIDVATEARGKFGLSAASPSYQDFVSTISEFRNRLTGVWNSFQSKNTSSAVGGVTIPRIDGLSQAVQIQEGSNDYDVQDFEQANALLADVSLPIDPTPVLLPARSSIQGQWTPTGSTMQSPTAYPKQRHDSWQAFPPTTSVTTNSGFPIPSPSFAGDEVDAIFHEMAYLDTNEWTTERAVGLRDFGFNDELAFMEFCNDPERIAIPPLDYNVTLSSSRQSWNFADHPA